MELLPTASLKSAHKAQIFWACFFAAIATRLSPVICQTQSIYSDGLPSAVTYDGGIAVGAGVMNISQGRTKVDGAKDPSASSFTFTLDHDAYTSAAVYNSSGVLIRTLWNKVRYVAGTHQANWDGYDDAGVQSPSDDYTIKLLHHNVSYAWDGVIGNTSSSFTGVIYNDGDPQHVADLAFDGVSTVYQAYGFTEGQYDVRSFDVASPQVVTNVVPSTNFTAFGLIATDGTSLYMANVGGTLDQECKTFVAVYRNNAPATFTHGKLANFTGSTINFPGCADMHTGVLNDEKRLVWDAATGLAVQKNGSLLAVAHGGMIETVNGAPTWWQGDDKIFLYDKNSGDQVGVIAISNPRRIAFAPNGDLWITAIGSPQTFAGQLIKVPASTFDGLSPSTAQKMITPPTPFPSTNLRAPLAIATTPAGEDVLIADGGVSQRIKVFSAANGAFLRAFGSFGGYAAAKNAKISSANNTFQFGSETGLTCLGDKSIWIADGGCGEGGTNRLLHLSWSGHNLDQIQFLNYGAGTVTVNANDPTRVFWNYLEFKVDYSQPLLPGDPKKGTTGWTLVNNWAAHTNLSDHYGGLNTVLNLGGRTYGLLTNYNGKNDLFELVTNGTLRPTGISFSDTYVALSTGLQYSLSASGELRSSTIDPSSSTQLFYIQPFSGLDQANNPTWGSPTLIASAASQPHNPLVDTGYPGTAGFQVPVTASGNVVVFDSDVTFSGYHLGAIAPNGTQFSWRSAPSTLFESPMEETGAFDIGDDVSYPGDQVVTSGHHIIYGYHGEGWNQNQGNQHMHYFDDGLFIGQFGTPCSIQSPLGPATPGAAGNDFSPSVIRNGNDTYLYTNDDDRHGGIHRWHLLGLDAVNEMSATVTRGQTASLIPVTIENLPYVAGPADLTAKSATESVALSWSPVSGAVSYNVKWSRGNPVDGNPSWPTGKGGPYNNVQNVFTTNYTVPNLVNNTEYHFVVTAMMPDGIETSPSYEVSAVPFDENVPVHFVGQLAVCEAGFNMGHATKDGVGDRTNNTIIPVVPEAPTEGRFAVQLPSMYDNLGTLSSIDFGSQGYCIFAYQGNADNLVSLPSGYSIVPRTGSWTPMVSNFLDLAFTIDGVTQAQAGGIQLVTTPPNPGTVTISVPDTAWHRLTVVCPAVIQSPRILSMKLTSNAGSQQSETFNSDSRFDYNYPTTTSPLSLNSIVQFAFKGNADLSLSLVSGDPSTAVISAIFIDDFPAQ